jgi:hypothetical protein
MNGCCSIGNAFLPLVGEALLYTVFRRNASLRRGHHKAIDNWKPIAGRSSVESRVFACQDVAMLHPEGESGESRSDGKGFTHGNREKTGFSIFI